MRRVTVVLAEDHPRVAKDIRHLLDDDFEVVAVVGHGEALVATASRLQPDVVVADISMPGMDGMQAVRELLAQRPSLRGVFVTVHDDPALARVALSLGFGYVLKASAGEELVPAVHAVLRGESHLSASLAARLR